MSRSFDRAIDPRQRKSSFLPQTEEAPEEVRKLPVPDTEAELGEAASETPTRKAEPKVQNRTTAEQKGQTYDVTVRLGKRHTRGLDRIVSDLRFDADRITSRSEIIRALIERLDADGHLRQEIIDGL